MADEKVKAGSLVTVSAKNEDKIFITHVEDDGTLQSKNALVSDIRNLAASLEDSEDKAINVKIAKEIVKKVTDLTSEIDTSFETVNQNFTNVNNAISQSNKSIETTNQNMTVHEEDTDIHVTKEKQDKWNGYEEGINNLTESVTQSIEDINSSLNAIANRPFFQAQLENSVTINSNQNLELTKVLEDKTGMLDADDKSKINIKEDGKYLVISKLANDSANEVSNQININSSGADGILAISNYMLNVGLYHLKKGDYINIYIVNNSYISFNVRANTKVTVVKVG